MSTSIWLMRHGSLAVTSERRFVGQRDIALSSAGYKQMLNWAECLHDIPFAAIISSPLSRCVESALSVRGSRTHIPLMQDPALQEISLGSWEGLTVQEVEEGAPGAYLARGRDLRNFRPAQGESFADLGQRVLPAFDRWVEVYAGSPVLVMAHAGVNRVILARHMAIPLHLLLTIPQPYACCTVLEL